MKDPGITQKRSGERIDYVYAAGPSTTLDAQLVGERGGEDVEIVGAADWTSDHRAVLSAFEVTPAPMPTLVAVDARLGMVGDEIEVTYNSPEANKAIDVVPEGGEPGDALETLDAPGDRSTTSFDTAGWDPGGYDVVLSEEDGAETARISFYLRDPEAGLELSANRRTYARGEPIDVSWTRAPANRWDWLGVYKASAADPQRDDYLIWTYAAGHAAGTLPPTTDGGVTLGPDSQNEPWPLPDGDYMIHYLLADQYESAGTAEFRVRGTD